MANTRTEAVEPSDERVVRQELTWQQKLDQGKPLNEFDETKADADFNYRERMRESQARAEFEAKKRGATVKQTNEKGNE